MFLSTVTRQKLSIFIRGYMEVQEIRLRVSRNSNFPMEVETPSVLSFDVELKYSFFSLTACFQECDRSEMAHPSNPNLGSTPMVDSPDRNSSEALFTVSSESEHTQGGESFNSEPSDRTYDRG
ncbi:hypothetical protein NE237_022153 [Protea cynaroides]|uniref:Uncharacterized protein n=1 Tax=Protea cynaroides TaxID=273540 RepID=A0A9Q0HEJ9_9MAGN|nr:hypothetical protein NE237_022153 [Protea cynaroides]